MAPLLKITVMDALAVQAKVVVKRAKGRISRIIRDDRRVFILESLSVIELNLIEISLFDFILHSEKPFTN